MTIEQYLKQFTPEQWRDAAANFYYEYPTSAPAMIQLGFNLAQSDGWKYVAPVWMKEFEQPGMVKLSEVNDDDN